MSEGAGESAVPGRFPAPATKDASEPILQALPGASNPESGGAGVVPRPGSWQVASWRAFLRAHAMVTRELGQELESTAGIPLSWYDVLLQLAEAPGRRLRMAQLADHVLLSRSGLTRLVDRLQREGLVEREPAPDDARGTFTVLTPAGLKRLREATPVHLAGVQRHWLAHFDDNELRALGRLLSRVLPDAKNAGPARSGPAQPGSAQPGPVQSGPAQSGPIQPRPADDSG